VHSSALARSIGFVFSLAVLGFAQTPPSTDLKLKGDRFKPLTADQLTPQQKTMADWVTANVGTLGGPANVLLRSPVMGEYAEQMYNELRLHSAIPPKLNEFSTMIVARAWTAQLMWYVHSRAAARAGLSKETIDAVAAGKRPASMKHDEEVVYNFSDELLTNKHASDAAWNALVDQFGEKGAVDLMGNLGYFNYGGDDGECRPVPVARWSPHTASASEVVGHARPVRNACRKDAVDEPRNAGKDPEDVPAHQ
jgi:4-carboxymuconolactone decarboxylase